METLILIFMLALLADRFVWNPFVRPFLEGAGKPRKPKPAPKPDPRIYKDGHLTPEYIEELKKETG
jgi:hypothetical protein